MRGLLRVCCFLNMYCIFIFNLSLLVCSCLNHCTYCKTKHSRGNLASYYPHEIISRAIQAFEEGVVELWLTSEDTGAYGRDIGVTLPELLWQLVEVMPEGSMLRIGMTNPPYIMEHLEVIIITFFIYTTPHFYYIF